MRRPPGLPFAVLVCLAIALVAALAGCKTAPPAPPPAVLCEPLPACDIPTGSTPKQLQEALWTCVLEYRALYSVCYHMQHAEELPHE